jgi:hypothetical protein
MIRRRRTIARTAVTSPEPLFSTWMEGPRLQAGLDEKLSA